MKKLTSFKRSVKLDDMYDAIYDKLLAENKYFKFKPIMKRVSTAYFENEYLGLEEYATWGATLANKAAQLKQPIYLVHGKRSNTYSFFIGSLSSVQKTLTEELRKVNIIGDLKKTIKIINALDAAILAYLALAPKPLKETSALKLLSKENLPLGQCLLNISGKYSKEVKDQANIYREWAIYKTVDSKRKNLDLYKIVK